MKQRNIYKEVAVVALLMLAVAAAEYVFFDLARLDWHAPMLYGGDGIYWVGQVKISFGGLTQQMGWPFYQPPNPYDPNYDLIYDIFVAICGLFTKDVGVVFNLYILVIPFANALGAYAAFRLLGVRRWLGGAVALTFAMCPYVQQRLGGHMMLAASQFVPFSVLLCLWCAEDETFNKPGKGFFRNPRNWLCLAVAWGIANNGAAYYPYFTCFLLCVTALCQWLRTGRASAMVPCFVTVAEIVLWMIPDFFPMVLGMLAGVGSTKTNGVYRSPVGGDLYGMRISSLLLSPNGYGWQKLGDWIKHYFHLVATDEGAVFNENSMGYLGMAGIVGLLGLLLLLFAPERRPAQGQQPGKPALMPRLWMLARLNVAALLFGTIAGFGPIISIVVTFMRGNNRISIYVAGLALTAVALGAEALLQRCTAPRCRAAVTALLVLCLGYGFWEQQGFYNPKYEAVQTIWYQDRAFMQQVEQTAGENAMLFQLPYMKNFENGSVENMWDYTLLRGPLHCDTLRFSYGAGYGTENDVWYKNTAELPPQAMVAELRAQGFAGIYLDLNGYAVDKQQQTLRELVQAAGCTEADVLRHEAGMLCYIPLDAG